MAGLGPWAHGAHGVRGARTGAQPQPCRNAAEAQPDQCTQAVCGVPPPGQQKGPGRPGMGGLCAQQIPCWDPKSTWRPRPLGARPQGGAAGRADHVE